MTTFSVLAAIFLPFLFCIRLQALAGLKCPRNHAIYVPYINRKLGTEKDYPLVEIDLHIFPHLKIGCDGTLFAWRFLTKKSVVNDLYLGVFRWSTQLSGKIILVNYTNVNSFKTAVAPYGTWVMISASINVKAGDFLGFYYKSLQTALNTQGTILTRPYSNKTVEKAIILPLDHSDLCVNHCLIEFSESDRDYSEPALLAFITRSTVKSTTTTTTTPYYDELSTETISSNAKPGIAQVLEEEEDQTPNMRPNNSDAKIISTTMPTNSFQGIAVPRTLPRTGNTEMTINSMLATTVSSTSVPKTTATDINVFLGKNFPELVSTQATGASIAFDVLRSSMFSGLRRPSIIPFFRETTSALSFIDKLSSDNMVTATSVTPIDARTVTLLPTVPATEEGQGRTVTLLPQSTIPTTQAIPRTGNTEMTINSMLATTATTVSSTSVPKTTTTDSNVFLGKPFPELVSTQATGASIVFDALRSSMFSGLRTSITPFFRETASAASFISKPSSDNMATATSVTPIDARTVTLLPTVPATEEEGQGRTVTLLPQSATPSWPAGSLGRSFLDPVCQVAAGGRWCSRWSLNYYFNSDLNVCHLSLGCLPPGGILPFISLSDCRIRCELGSKPATVVYVPVIYEDNSSREITATPSMTMPIQRRPYLRQPMKTAPPLIPITAMNNQADDYYYGEVEYQRRRTEGRGGYESRLGTTKASAPPGRLFWVEDANEGVPFRAPADDTITVWRNVFATTPTPVLSNIFMTIRRHWWQNSITTPPAVLWAK